MHIDVVVEFLPRLKAPHDIRVANPDPSEDGSINLALGDELLGFLGGHVRVQETLGVLDEGAIGTEDIVLGRPGFAWPMNIRV